MKTKNKPIVFVTESDEGGTIVTVANPRFASRAAQAFDSVNDLVRPAVGEFTVPWNTYRTTSALIAAGFTVKVVES
jgi:hypothetical protein